MTPQDRKAPNAQLCSESETGFDTADIDGTLAPNACLRPFFRHAQRSQNSTVECPSLTG